MERKISFIANDGTSFTSEKECIDYENSLKAKVLLDELKIYNAEGEEIDLTKINYKSLYQMQYIVIRSEEAYRFLKQVISGLYGFRIPSYEIVQKKNYVCSFYFDNDICAWINIEDTIDKLIVLKKQLKEEISNLQRYAVFTKADTMEKKE